MTLLKSFTDSSAKDSVVTCDSIATVHVISGLVIWPMPALHKLSEILRKGCHLGESQFGLYNRSGVVPFYPLLNLVGFQ